MSKRAILYARVSGDDRKYATSSIEGQLAECRDFAVKRGYTVINEVFENPDKHTSGADWLPEIENLLRLAPTRTFDVLICREMDRLARGLAKQLVVEGEFARSGVELAYVLGDYADTPEGALMKNIRAVISEYERYKITERMQRGKRLKAQAGNVVLNGAPLYGYQRADDDKASLAIDVLEAAVVKMIFDWYTGDEGLSMRAIAKRLTNLGIPTAADSGKGRGKGRGKIRSVGMWGTSTIARILSNSTYHGSWFYSKYADDPERLIEVAVPAIVSKEVFDLAQDHKKENRIVSSRNVKHDYLFRRRVTCGECGGAMVALMATSKNKQFFYYNCAVPNDKIHFARTCTQTKHFRADHVDELVWRWVKSYLADPAKMAAGLEAYQSEHDRETTPLRDRLSILDKLIADNKEQINRLLDLYLVGNFPKDALLERKTRLADTLTTLEREQEVLTNQLTAKSLTENEVQSLFDFAAEVAQGLEKADQDFETRRRIIEILDLQITLAIEKGEKILYPRCRFWDGGRLSIASTNTSTCAHAFQQHNTPLLGALHELSYVPYPI